MSDLIHSTRSPHACDQLACQEKQVATDRREAQKERHVMHNTTALNPLKTTAQEYGALADAIGISIAVLIDAVDGLNIQIAGLRERRKRLEKLKEAAAAELTEELGDVA